MRILIALCAGILPVASANAAIINEFLSDDAFGDTNEFIELFGTPGESLAGLSLIIIDNDNGGSTTSSAYRRVNVQYDFTTEVIPADGYFVLGGGPDLAGIADFPISVGDLQNGSQTYALVNTADIEFEPDDDDQLTQDSIDDIEANASDIIATWNEDTGDLFDFTPLISLDFGVDAASRLPNGVDTDSASDWTVFSTFDDDVELGAANDTFMTPGAANAVVPEPTTVALALLGFAAVAGRKRG